MTVVDELKDEIIDGIYANQFNLLLSAVEANLIERETCEHNSLSMENMYHNLFTLLPIVLEDCYTTPIAPKVLSINQAVMKKRIDRITDIEVVI